MLKAKRKTRNNMPTPKQMAAFHEKYKNHWDKICLNQEFLDIFTLDLVKAEEIVKKLLVPKIVKA